MLLFVLNVAAVLYVSQSFIVAIVFYAPAMVFALIAFVLAYRSSGRSLLLFAVAGIVLSLVAAVIQQTQTGIPSLRLTHNALYHLVQAAGLLLIFLTARGLALPGMIRSGCMLFMFHVKQINQYIDVSRETLIVRGVLPGLRLAYSAASWATVGASPATVVRRTSRGWFSS